MSRGGLIAATMLSLLPACIEVPWGNGGLGDELGIELHDTTGLLLVLGPHDLEAASTALAETLAGAWQDGVVLTGAAPLSDAHGRQLTLEWEALRVLPGAARLAVEGDGVRVDVPVRIGGAELEVELDGASLPDCRPALIAGSATLTLQIALGSDKSGRIQATLGQAALAGDDLAIDWSGCPEVQAAPSPEAWSRPLWDTLAEASAEALGGELVTALPDALGLDVALGVATTVAVDEIGAGVARVSVEARPAAAGGAWCTVNGELVVPLSVGIDVEPHPCVSAAALPPVASLPPPDFGASPSGALMVSATTLRRGLAALWLSGAICGDHATAGRSLEVSATGVGWAPLIALAPETPLTLALWPRELPDASLTGEDGEVLVSTGLMDVDVYGELDGAAVRLFSLSIDADVGLALSASADGLLSSRVRRLTLRAGGLRAGLLTAPDPSIAEAIVEPIVRALLDGQPLLRLPPHPGARAAPARVVGDYLAIPR